MDKAMGPVPTELSLRDGRRVTLRTVQPGDREAVQAAIMLLSPEARYARFMAPLRELSPQMLNRAVNPTPERELQLVAICERAGKETIVGGARYAAAPGSSDCEFALTVAEEWQGQGLARQLLEVLMQAARAAGFQRMEGYILASNSRMLGLARRLGFERVESPEGPTVHAVRRDLSAIDARNRETL
jgi:RimJ/RimL family protein N-acetyltransferase